MAAERPRFDQDFQDTLAQLFAWRRDVRRFRNDPVPASVVDRLLEMANLAPSVGNSQPWRWVRVDCPKRRAGIKASFEACNAAAAQDYVAETRLRYLALKLEGLEIAPVQFAVFCDEATEQGKGLGRQTMPETLAYSTVVSVHSFWLAARAHGVGVGWVSILRPDAVKALLDVPESWRLVAYLCVGWPEEEHDDPELVRFGWQQRSAAKVIQR